jgi:ubiquitin-like modifier-activating enzyme ATG7
MQDAQGIQMEIPMPGHPVSPSEAAGVLEDCKRLKELVSSHGAIFLLTDTRESRWLPTLLCTYENKVNLIGVLELYETLVVLYNNASLHCRLLLLQH